MTRDALTRDEMGDEMGDENLPGYLGSLVGAPFWSTCP
jgi:hypothetical protein